jgi:hypothetical protein
VSKVFGRANCLESMNSQIDAANNWLLSSQFSVQREFSKSAVEISRVASGTAVNVLLGALYISGRWDKV